MILLRIQDLDAFYADVALYYFGDLCFSDVDVVGDAPKTFTKILAVLDSALSQCEAKSDHQFFDFVVLGKRISSAHVGHGLSHDFFYLFALSLLKQVNKNFGHALIDQLITKDSAIDEHVGEEPHDLICELMVEFEETDEGRNTLVAGYVLVERGVD